MSCDSLMPFNRRELTVAYARCLSFRIASIALTSLGEVPVPLNSRMGAGTSFAAGGEQDVRASEAMHEMSWMLRFFTLAIFYTFGPRASDVRLLSNRNRRLL